MLFVESGASTSSVAHALRPTLRGMLPGLSNHPHLIDNANAVGILRGSVFSYCAVHQHSHTGSNNSGGYNLLSSSCGICKAIL